MSCETGFHASLIPPSPCPNHSDTQAYFQRVEFERLSRNLWHFEKFASERSFSTFRFRGRRASVWFPSCSSSRLEPLQINGEKSSGRRVLEPKLRFVSPRESSSPKSDNRRLVFSRKTSEQLLTCFHHLGVRGPLLFRCLKYAARLEERDVINLLITLNSQGFKRMDIKAMFCKYPLLIKLSGSHIEEYVQFYLGLGFTKSVVLSLFVIRPALLVCDLERVSQVIEFLMSLGMDEDILSVILPKRPQVLEVDVELLNRTVSALMQADISQLDIIKLFRRAPTIFTASQKNIHTSLKFWSGVGVEGKDLCRALLRRPNLLNYNIEDMHNTCIYLQNWMEPSDVAKLASKFAELLTYDPQTKIEPLIHYMMQFGLTGKDVRKIILRRPQLMSCTIARMDSTVRYLRGLGLTEKVLGKVFIMSPQVFTLNANDKLKRGVQFFQSLGIDEQRDMEFLFSRNAQVFCCSIERNLQPTFEFFLSIGLDKKVVSKMIVLFPSMLGQNVQRSLAPKYQYLTADMNRSVEELIEFPQYFGYSLEKRIKPRHKLLSERGLHISLPSMLACTEKDFQKRHILPFDLVYQTSEVGKHLRKKHVISKKQQPKMKATSILTSEDSLNSDIQTKGNKCSNSNVNEQYARTECQLIDRFQTCVPETEKLLNLYKGVQHEIEKKELQVFSGEVPIRHVCKEQMQFYPATFVKYYKNLSPLGIWIHAYVLEQ